MKLETDPEKEHSVFMRLREKGTGLHHLNDYIVLCVFLHNIRSPSTGTDYVSSFSSAAGASGRKCISTLHCAVLWQIPLFFAKNHQTLVSSWLGQRTHAAEERRPSTRKIDAPTMPEMRDATMMPSFAAERCAKSGKASEEIKRDIVKPMPARQPAPTK